MEKLLNAFLDRFSALHKDIKSALENMDQAGLDWVPAGEANSVNVLVTHLAAAEKFWAVEIPLGRKSERVRSEEFFAKGLTKQELELMLDESLEQIRNTFAGLAIADLEQERYSEPHDMNVSCGWAILHALDHSAIHTGHIQLTCQIWKEKIHKQKR